MSISVGTDPTKAFNDLSRLERKIRAMIRRNGGALRPSASSVSKNRRNEVRYTGELRVKLAKAVEETTRSVASEIEANSPRWSSWLASNFEHTQGAKPAFGVIPEPVPKTRGQFSALVQPIVEGKALDGTKPQYIFNNVNYAEEVAKGNFPGISAALDWYLDIGQFHVSGGYLRKAIKTVGGR